MEEQGYEIIWLPADQFFEGEGDALFAGDALFCGYKFRTDVSAHRAVADMLGCLVISVELVDPRFYHIDTCFCPLTDGGAVWFPAAFDEYGQRAIRESRAESDRRGRGGSGTLFLQRRRSRPGDRPARRARPS